jgi:hypothetical protein
MPLKFLAGIGDPELDGNWPALSGATTGGATLHTGVATCGAALVAIGPALADTGNPPGAIAGGASGHGHGPSSHHTLIAICFLHEGFEHPCSSYHSYSRCHLRRHYSREHGASSASITQM